MALSGLSTLIVRMAEKFMFSTFKQYSKALKSERIKILMTKKKIKIKSNTLFAVNSETTTLNPRDQREF